MDAYIQICYAQDPPDHCSGSVLTSSIEEAPTRVLEAAREGIERELRARRRIKMLAREASEEHR